MKRVFILLFVEIFYFVISQNVFLYKRCNDEYCMYSDGINRKLVAAANQCYQSQQFLLEVPDLNTGRLLDEFVKHYLHDDDDVFLNLKGIKSKWHWTDGNEYDNVIAVKDDSEESNFAFIKIDDSDNLHVCASNFSADQQGWICSKKSQCPSPRITIGNECYFARNAWKGSFYEAMQDCFLLGATFASFNNMKEELIVEKMKMILETNKHYWVGLTKDVWTWSYSRKVMSFNLFGYGLMKTNTECIKSTYNHYDGYSKWYPVSCYKEIKSICMEKNPNKNSGINTSEELNIPLIIGWILAAIFIIAFIILLIIHIVKMRNKKIERKPISRTNTVFPGESNNPPKRPQNLPPDRRSDTIAKLGSSDYYESTHPISEDDKYTELYS